MISLNQLSSAFNRQGLLIGQHSEGMYAPAMDLEKWLYGHFPLAVVEYSFGGPNSSP